MNTSSTISTTIDASTATHVPLILVGLSFAGCPVVRSRVPGGGTVGTGSTVPGPFPGPPTADGASGIGLVGRASVRSSSRGVVTA
ncbi:hypothetical protein GCM10027184_30570 [Saccharothrix stipae]